MSLSTPLLFHFCLSCMSFISNTLLGAKLVAVHAQSVTIAPGIPSHVNGPRPYPV